MSNNRFEIAPYFVVPDVVKSAEFYRDKLGFTFGKMWGEPPCFTMVGRGGITIMLKSVAGRHLSSPNNRLNQDCCWDAYVWVEDADALYHEFRTRGVEIAREIENQPYGCRDFDVRDPDGYVLCFGSSLDA
jgi:uncharacterized glyoxalase superfamily protein PhnB